jgi:hypothetical protein
MRASLSSLSQSKVWHSLTNIVNVRRNWLANEKVVNRWLSPTELSNLSSLFLQSRTLAVYRHSSPLEIPWRKSSYDASLLFQGRFSQASLQCLPLKLWSDRQEIKN